MNKTSIIEHILKEQGNSFDSCFFGNTTFIDLEPFRHKLKRNWRSASLLSAVLADIEPDAFNIYPDKRFSWVSLLRVSAEYSLYNLSPEDLYRLFKLSFIWSDNKLLQLATNAYQRLNLPLPFDSQGFVQHVLDQCVNQQQQVITFQRLQSEMLVDFYWQYACKDLVQHCGLPHFTSNQQWYQWVDDLATETTELDFIKHKDWGVVGGLYCNKVEDLGFLQFWVGRDFRNQGLATRAIQQWLALQKEQHLQPLVYAEVMQSNIAGRQTLVKTGFRRVLVDRVAPNQKRFFYRLGPQKNFVNTYRELQTLSVLFADIKELAKPMSAKELQHSLQERLENNISSHLDKK